jgi:hypothetical protein
MIGMGDSARLLARLESAAFAGITAHFGRMVCRARLASVAGIAVRDFVPESFGLHWQCAKASKNPTCYRPNHRTGVKPPDDFVARHCSTWTDAGHGSIRWSVL